MDPSTILIFVLMGLFIGLLFLEFQWASRLADQWLQPR